MQVYVGARKGRWRGKWKIDGVGEGERERENTLQLCPEFFLVNFLFAGSDFV